LAPIIEIRDYTWRYLYTQTPALDNVSLSIEAGSFVGVIGPNGAGKTTLAYSIDGLIPGQYRGIKQGTVSILGKEVETYAPGQLQRLVGVVFSDPEAQFTAMTVEDELVFGMENLGMSLAEIRERLEWVTALAELGPLLDKPPYEISGGQKQRVALAAVLAMTPQVLILDEPTSMLDPISRKRVFEVLVRLKQEQRNTIIVIEHSLENLTPLADRMVLLAEGRVALEGETRAFFSQMDTLLEHGIHPSGPMLFFHRLAQAGCYDGPPPLTVDEAARSLEKVVARRRQPGPALVIGGGR
jgi:energy-coupling factor transporter ATP-binding protein EcfA2